MYGIPTRLVLNRRDWQLGVAENQRIQSFKNTALDYFILRQAYSLLPSFELWVAKCYLDERVTCTGMRTSWIIAETGVTSVTLSGLAITLRATEYTSFYSRIYQNFFLFGISLG
jgi:hypothetical protein